MRHLIDLIDIARNFGIYGVDGRSAEPTLKLYPADDAVFRLLEQCQPFVFSDDGVFIRTSLDGDPFKRGSEEVALDAPFRVFSIEVAGDAMLSQFTSVQGERREVYCIVSFERAPRQFQYFILMQMYGMVDGDLNARPTKVVFADNNSGDVVQHFLGRLARETTGHEPVRAKVKIGQGKTKRLHVIRSVIHVAPKTRAPEYTGTRAIDWSHRFAVRGHWRKQDGIGKDRAGVYCVNGFTWVSEHIRGPEHLPFIKKTRLVEE